jgi:hypothetical protein
VRVHPGHPYANPHLCHPDRLAIHVTRQLQKRCQITSRHGCNGMISDCYRTNTTEIYRLIIIKSACIGSDRLVHVGDYGRGRMMGNHGRKEKSEINTAQSGRGGHVTWSALISGAIALVCFASSAKSDEGGVSFWLPGLFGSLAAAPQQPGWSLSTVYYHTTVSAGADVARAREITIGRIPVNLSANLSATSMPERLLPWSIQPTYSQRHSWAARRRSASWEYMVAPARRLRGRSLAHWPSVPALRQHQRLSYRVRRLVPAVFCALEHGRPQLHDLHHR